MIQFLYRLDSIYCDIKYIISFIEEIRFTILNDIRFYMDHRNLKNLIQQYRCQY